MGRWLKTVAETGRTGSYGAVTPGYSATRLHRVLFAMKPSHLSDDFVNLWRIQSNTQRLDLRDNITEYFSILLGVVHVFPCGYGDTASFCTVSSGGVTLTSRYRPGCRDKLFLGELQEFVY